MNKVILLTGATDGIGYETAKMLIEQGHTVLIHGRNAEKLAAVRHELIALKAGRVETFVADLSNLDDVRVLAKEVNAQYPHLDIIINNAGVFKTTHIQTTLGVDVRFVVNTLAPYLLTKLLMPSLTSSSRVVNLSSAAQSPVNIEALLGKQSLSDSDAYAQSKLAITMWSKSLGEALQGSGPMIVSVNPKSLLASKMVKDAYGIPGSDITVGADILVKASLSSEFEHAHGLYFDNDIGEFSKPHPDALNKAKVDKVMKAIESLTSL